MSEQNDQALTPVATETTAAPAAPPRRRAAASSPPPRVLPASPRPASR